MKLDSQLTGMGAATAFWLIALTAGGVAALMSPDLFGARGEPDWPVIVFLGMAPVAILVGVSTAWVLLGFDKLGLAWLTMAAPLLWVGVGAAVFLFGGQA